MSNTWKDSVYRQREDLARILRDPIEQLAQQLLPQWSDRAQLEDILVHEFDRIPFCTSLYLLDTNGLQICDNVGRTGLVHGHFGRDRSQRPYMKEAVPVWGFLLSDAYISLTAHRPSLTALQILRTDDEVLGYLGADFDLRDLPVTSDLYQEPGSWRQVKGDPAIRNQLFQQTRVDSPMDRNLPQVLAILEELLSQRGVFQLQLHFSSSQSTIWFMNDPFRYRMLDIEALTDADICLVYPCQTYPADAQIPADRIPAILETFARLRNADENIYLRTASINLFNGMINLNFSCDGSHHMHYDEFLQKNISFWFGVAA